MSEPSGGNSPISIVVVGVVAQGDQRGRTLGFPTANIPLSADELDDGVWAGWVRVGQREPLAAAISVGRRATFYGHRGQRLLEAHLLDFDDDIYGETIEVELALRLRGQRAFSSPADLVAQLGDDVSRCRAWSAGPIERNKEGRWPVVST